MGLVEDKSSLLKIEKKKIARTEIGSLSFAWDLSHFFLFSKSGTGMMPKLNEIKYKNSINKKTAW